MSGAIVVEATGGPEVLQWQQREVGAPGDGEIRLRQTAVGVNFIDTYQRSGLYKRALPFVAGSEGVGIVTAVGAEVEGIAVGDRVGYTGVLGAYAEERLLPAERALAIPDPTTSTTRPPQRPC